MQPLNPPDSEKFQAVVKAIQYERMMRYMPAGGGNIESAFRYYLWNSRLCESFHFVLHISEITCRNTFNSALTARCGANWYDSPVLQNRLNDRYRDELEAVVADETGQHGAGLTAHHIVSALTFGFWDHLATKRFERLLWSEGVQRLFPHAPKGTSRNDVHNRIETVRRWRNRIAHHRCIFDKGPMRQHTEALDLIGWICPDTRS